MIHETLNRDNLQKYLQRCGNTVGTPRVHAVLRDNREIRLESSQRGTSQAQSRVENEYKVIKWNIPSTQTRLFSNTCWVFTYHCLITSCMLGFGPIWIKSADGWTYTSACCSLAL